MKVTDVRIRRFNSEGKMRAIVSVTLNDQLWSMMSGLSKGITAFVAMPQADPQR